jgi:glycyl-tRNA synthetase beta chain
MNGELLLEIGTEEIPAGYLANGLKSFLNLTLEMLKESRIEMDTPLHVYGTPRRMILVGRGLPQKQEDMSQEITGPPKSVAYDQDGHPTKAAEGFAKKQGVSIDELSTTTTSKGEYLYVKRQVAGKSTGQILAEILPKVVERIPWPKTMRWGSVGFSFVRPIHWILALFDGEIIPFTIAGIKADTMTFGHRFLAPDAVRVSNTDEYLQAMKKGFVIIDQEEREKLIEEKIEAVAREVGGKPGQDPELLSTVANLVEYPSAICGRFDEAFLRLPAPILITPMKEHQKYFAVYSSEGGLMPNFVAINNTLARDEMIVQTGHERVLRARLSDADFFFEEDRKRPLGSRLDDLKRVIFQAQLGTSYEKVMRFTELAEFLGNRVLPDQLDDIRTVAELCKCDLETQMVTEFPSLQGTMGREYARLEGYPEEICTAIHEHYLPDRAGGKLPDSKIGAIVGLADRMDTICGYFVLGMEPSGTADPYALRRHAIGILRILETFAWDLSLVGFIMESLSILKRSLTFEMGPAADKVLQFFRERYKQLMLRNGFESEYIDAVISTGFDYIYLVKPRIEQVRGYALESVGVEALAFTFKRIINMLKREKRTYEVDPDLFQEECERALWRQYQEVSEGMKSSISSNRYAEAMDVLARLKSPVDEFFDGVEILTKDSPALRQNRIGLLQELAGLFLSIADFSKLSI